MTQLQSWDGRLVDWYEKNLGLRGGYSRKIHRGLPSSLANSEYVQELPHGLKIVARSGKRLSTPIKIEPHYNHPYGNPTSVSDMRKKLIKKLYEKKIIRR